MIAGLDCRQTISSAKPGDPEITHTTEKLMEQLSPAALGAHNRSNSGGRRSRQHLVSSWLARQSEQLPGGENEAAVHEEPPSVYSMPAIVLSTAEEAASDETVLVPEQISTRPVHGARSGYARLPVGRLADGGNVSPEQKGPVGERRLGPGGRRLAVYPNMSLVDELITEEEEEDECNRDDVQEHTGDPSTTAETQIFLIQSEEQLDTPRQSPSHQQRPGSSRKRAHSYPADAPIPALPLLELPTRQTVPAEASDDDQLKHDGEGPPKGGGLQQSASKMGRFAQMALMAKKWKRRSLGDGSTAHKLSSKEATASRQRKRPLVEVPRALKLDLLSEAYPMVQRTYQMYISELGPKHTLTESANRHLQELATQLGRQT